MDFQGKLSLPKYFKNLFKKKYSGQNNLILLKIQKLNFYTSPKLLQKIFECFIWKPNAYGSFWNLHIKINWKINISVIRGEGSLGFPDLWSGQKPWWNWYLTPVVSFIEVWRAQLTKSTFLTSTLELLESFRMIKREWGAESNGTLPHLLV